MCDVTKVMKFKDKTSNYALNVLKNVKPARISTIIALNVLYRLIVTIQQSHSVYVMKDISKS